MTLQIRLRQRQAIVRVLYNKAAAVSYGDDRRLRFMTLTLAGLLVANIYRFRPFDPVLGLASFAGSSAPELLHRLGNCQAIFQLPELRGCRLVQVINFERIRRDKGMQESSFSALLKSSESMIWRICSSMVTVQ
jgi:hypothetical protein